jgi:DNA-binding transcriptional MerR regulator
MPTARVTLNGFTAKQVNEITGLSLPMIDYLRRTDFLQPHYQCGASRRGRVRYYSYRDLVAARLVQRLRDVGVELYKLKAAVKKLASSSSWAADHSSDPREHLNWLVSDGREVLLKNEDGFLDTFRADGQRAFAFVVNLRELQAEVLARIPEEKQASFCIKNRKLRFAGNS